MTVGRSVDRWLGPLRSGIFGSAAFAISFFMSAGAYAVSDRVKSACRNDYFQHCSQFSVGSEELRQCMRKIGEDLSTPCLVALVQEGEITKEDVDRHNAQKEVVPKPAPAKSAPPKKMKNAEVVRESVADPKGVGAKSSKSAKKHKAAPTLKQTKKVAVPAQTPAVGKTKKSAKGLKSKKPVTKSAAAGAAVPTKGPVKKISHKAKVSKTSKSVGTPPATKSVKPGTPLKKAPTTKSAKAKTKAGTKVSAKTTAKAKKTSKKKNLTKHVAKPVDATAP